MCPGNVTKRMVLGAATVVALVSLWLYQPEEQSETPQSGWWQFDGSPDYSTKEKAAPPPTVEVPDVQTGSDEPGYVGAVAGAAVVLMGQALYILLRKWMARSKATASTPLSEQQKTLAADLGALLRSGHSSDVTFTVGESQLRAHRAILVARSPVFAAMMAHDCIEASSGHIAVTDIEADVMTQLLEFLYTDEVKLVDPLMAQKLLAAADKYQLPTLKEQCELVIAMNLCVENAAACAVLAIRHSCSWLRDCSARFIATHFREVMATKGWADAVRKHPDHVVEVSRLVAAASPDTTHTR